jgi:serine/threonine protein kinase
MEAPEGYEVIELLASGENPDSVLIFRASRTSPDPKLPPTIICKTFQNLITSPSQEALLRHEYGILQSLNSPLKVAGSDDRQELLVSSDQPSLPKSLIIKTFGVQKAASRLCLTLEDIGGNSFRATFLASLQSTRRVAMPNYNNLPHMTMPMFLYSAYHITRALAYVHSCHIVHRDVNPDNMIISRRYEDIESIDQLSIQLIDFNLAMSVEKGKKYFPSGSFQGYANIKFILTVSSYFADEMPLGAFVLDH